MDGIPFSLETNFKQKTACDRDDSALMPLGPLLRLVMPYLNMELASIKFFTGTLTIPNIYLVKFKLKMKKKLIKKLPST